MTDKDHTPERRQADSPAYNGPERRKDYLQWRAKVERRLEEGSVTMKQLSADIAENTATTKQVQADTSELVVLLQSFKGAFRVLELLGKAAKPLGAIATLCAALMGLWSIFSNAPHGK